jgi:uncharacterized membrane protein
MDVGHLVVIILFGVITVAALFFLPQVWRVEADVQKPEATKYWPFGEALRAGFLRALPVGIIAAFILELATTAAFFEDELTGGAQDVAGQLTIWLGSVFVLCLLLDVSVTLFNVPKVVVPPAARDERGALSLWWSSRRSKARR